MSGRTRRASAEDCNPLHRRVPAEIVSRRKHAQVVEADDDTITVDRKTVFLLKPDRRHKWLTKALKMASEGEVHTSDVYDIIASTRFAEDLPYKLGQKMSRLVHQQLSLFSAKQQKFLSSEASLHVKFGQVSTSSKDSENDTVKNGEKKNSNSADLEDMMARCRAFVREKAMERGEVEEAASDIAEKPQSGSNEAGSKPAKKEKRKASTSSSSSSADRKKRGRSKTRKTTKKNGDDKKKKKKKKSSSSSSASKSKAKGEKRKRKSSSSSSSSKKRRNKKKQDRKTKSSSSSEASKSKKRGRSKSSNAKRRRKSKSSESSRSPKKETKKSAKQ